MLYDLIKVVLTAETPQERENAYRQLERVGMDRLTANVLASELKKEVR